MIPRLQDLSFEEYLQAQDSGVFWIVYPEATGIYGFDVVDKNDPRETSLKAKNTQESSVRPYEYYESHGSISQFNPEKPKEKHPHYFKHWSGKLDPYRICDLFEVNDAAISHAVKKLLCTGNRGHKDFRKDIEDVIDTLERKLEMIDEDEVKS